MRWYVYPYETWHELRHLRYEGLNLQRALDLAKKLHRLYNFKPHITTRERT